jgi:hypothetical protein
MRPDIVYTLWKKEARRQLANRGGAAMIALLIAAAVLLGIFSRPAVQTGAANYLGGVHHCFIDYPDYQRFAIGDDRLPRWIAHLRANVPPELAQQLVFRPYIPELLAQRIRTEETIGFEIGTGAIQIMPENPSAGVASAYVVAFRHPGDRTVLAHYEAWFIRESRRFFEREAGLTPSTPDGNAINPTDDIWLIQSAHAHFRDRVNGPDSSNGPVPAIEFLRGRVRLKTLDSVSLIAMAMNLFAMFFFCVYLMPSLTSEERERGLLLQQALTPAAAGDLFLGKLLFYQPAAMLLAALLTLCYDARVLTVPFYWYTVWTVSMGFTGIGVVISCLARTQRGASMGAMCYLLAVSLILVICQALNIPGLPYLAMEFYGPRLLQAAISRQIELYHWRELVGAVLMATIWVMTAVVMFRRRSRD